MSKESLKDHLQRWVEKYQTQLLMGVLVLFIAGGGWAFYLYYKNHQPTPGYDEILLTDESIHQRQHTQAVYLADGSVNEDKNQRYLQHVHVPLTREKLPEFNQGETLFNSLIQSLESGSKADINQAAALFDQALEEYMFNTPTNLITAAVGNDIILFDEYYATIDGVERAGRGYFDQELAKKVLRAFDSPISIAIVGSRLLPVAHSQFVIDKESHLLDQFLSQPSWYEGMTQYYSVDEVEGATQEEKLKELFSRYDGRITSVYQVKLSGKFAADVDALILEDGDGELFVYGFYYEDPSYVKQTIGEYMDSEYSTFDNFTPDDLNWHNFEEGFNEFYNQSR